MTSFLLFRALAREIRFGGALRRCAGLKARRYVVLAGLKPASTSGLRRLYFVIAASIPSFRIISTALPAFVQHFCCYFQLCFLHRPKDVFPSAVELMLGTATKPEPGKILCAEGADH